MKILEVIIGILALLSGLFLLVLPLCLTFILMLAKRELDNRWEGWLIAGSVVCWIGGVVIIMIGLIWTRSAIRRAIAASSQQKPEVISQ